MPLSRRRLPARRYEEPLPRADGAFQPGIRRFTIQCNIWTLNGLLGRLNGIEGGPNATVRKPIADYVKNVLKGRKAHGIKHVLQKEWAQLPANQLHLTKEVAMPRAAGAKRARAGWRAPGEAAPSQLG